MKLRDSIVIGDPLSEVSEASEGDVRFLHPGTRIEVLDRSAGAPEGGAWLDSTIRQRLVYKSKAGKNMVDYEVSAPWTYTGTTDVRVNDFGKTWRLKLEAHR